MGVAEDLIAEASRGKRGRGVVEAWLQSHPAEAAEFWAYVRGVLSSGYPIYPTMGKLVKALGGPPGSPSSVRRFISEQLEKLDS